MTIGYGWEKRPDLVPEMGKLYSQLRTRVLQLDSGIEERVLRTYLAFAEQGNNFVVVIPNKRSLRVRLWFRPNLLIDTNGMAADIYGSYGEWRTEITYASMEQLDNVIDLIEQSRKLA